ncbi:MAG: hypothetical protein FWD93_02210 [Coriobacteriia bacterium]|nr:hypothetical protein [Coriobacteriia bacterium]
MKEAIIVAVIGLLGVALASYLNHLFAKKRMGSLTEKEVRQVKEIGKLTENAVSDVVTRLTNTKSEIRALRRIGRRKLQKDMRSALSAIPVGLIYYIGGIVFFANLPSILINRFEAPSYEELPVTDYAQYSEYYFPEPLYEALYAMYQSLSSLNQSLLIVDLWIMVAAPFIFIILGALCFGVGIVNAANLWNSTHRDKLFSRDLLKLQSELESNGSVVETLLKTSKNLYELGAWQYKSVSLDLIEPKDILAEYRRDFDVFQMMRPDLPKSIGAAENLYRSANEMLSIGGVDSIC